MTIVSKIRIILLLSGFLVRLLCAAQLSPGELSKSHTHLEGLSNCTKCHLLGQKVSSQKCLECHQEIKIRQIAAHGYHSSSVVKGKECFSCHSDHHGLTFQLIRFETDKFNHEITGFRLNGAHSKKQCADCHKSANVRDEKLKKRKNTFLGLDQKCSSCHSDEHQGSLSENCSGCHNTEHFKPAPGFNHQNADFKLVGKHQDVVCSSCHKITTKNGKKYQEFKGVRYNNCTSCHPDKHDGKFGQNCRDCHSEQSFTLVKNNEHFDHGKTRFRLEGKHQAVNCKACHKNKLTDAIKFTVCSDCHKDYHEQQFITSGTLTDCAECHTSQGFNESLYTIEKHGQSPFPLVGSHLAVPCNSCHKKSSKWNFRNIGKTCNDCHADIHYGNIRAKFYPQSDCRSCHNEESWTQVKFDHGKTDFILSGKHIGPSCRACHFTKDEKNETRQRFSGLSMNCNTCHEDIHFGQFENNGITDCSGCHNTSAFKPAALFNHEKTSFPLDGRHKVLACAKCHVPVNKKGVSFVLYKTGKTKCEDCHQ